MKRDVRWIILQGNRPSSNDLRMAFGICALSFRIQCPGAISLCVDLYLNPRSPIMMDSVILDRRFLLVISLHHHPILSWVVQGRRSSVGYLLERIRTGTAPIMVIMPC